MHTRPEKYYTLRDVIQFLKDFLRYLLRSWKVMVLLMITGAACGLAVYRIQKPRYEAVCNFILEEKTMGGGGLAGLASQFGFDLGSMTGGGSIFAGDNILDIIRSRRILDKVLLSPVDPGQPKGKTLGALYIETYGLEINDVEKPANDSLLQAIHERIVKKSLIVGRMNKKGSIINVQFNSPNSLLSRLMAERIVQESAKLYLEVKTGTAQANINQMQRKSDSILVLLNRKTYSVAAGQVLDVNPGMRTLTAPVEIGTRDKTVLATIYAEVTKNLEASKMLLSHQSPVIQLLDRPGEVLENKKLPMLLSVALYSFIAVFAGCFISFLFYSFKVLSK